MKALENRMVAQGRFVFINGKDLIRQKRQGRRRFGKNRNTNNNGNNNNNNAVGGVSFTPDEKVIDFLK